MALISKSRVRAGGRDMLREMACGRDQAALPSTPTRRTAGSASRIRSRFLPPSSAVARGHPGDVSARARKAGDKARANRIGGRTHDDRDFGGRLFRRRDARRLKADDDVNLQGHQLARQWKASRSDDPSADRSSSVIVLPFDVAQFPQSFTEFLAGRGRDRDCPASGRRCAASCPAVPSRRAVSHAAPPSNTMNSRRCMSISRHLGRDANIARM